MLNVLRSEKHKDVCFYYLHSTLYGCANLCNKARKINKRHNDWKGRSKHVFADITIVCRKSNKIYKKAIISQRVNLKSIRYKIKIRNNLLYLNTLREELENVINK